MTLATAKHVHAFRIIGLHRTAHTRIQACDTCGITLPRIGLTQNTPVSQPPCRPALAGADTRSMV